MSIFGNLLAKKNRTEKLKGSGLKKRKFHSLCDGGVICQTHDADHFSSLFKGK